MTEATMPVTVEQGLADELVERVAKAMFEAEHKGLSNCYEWDDHWEEYQEAERPRYYKRAKAAIEVLNTRATPPSPAGLAGELEEAGEHWRTFKSSWLHKHGAWPTEGIDAMQALNRLLPNSCGPKEVKRLTALTANGSQPDRVVDVLRAGGQRLRADVAEALANAELDGPDPDDYWDWLAKAAIDRIADYFLSTLDAKDQSND